MSSLLARVFHTRAVDGGQCRLVMLLAPGQTLAFSGFLPWRRQNFPFSYGNVSRRACPLMQVLSPLAEERGWGLCVKDCCGFLGPLHADESWTRSSKSLTSYRRVRDPSPRCQRPPLPSSLPLCCFHELYKASQWYYRPRSAAGPRLLTCDPITWGRATFPCPPRAKPFVVSSVARPASEPPAFSVTFRLDYNLCRTRG